MKAKERAQINAELDGLDNQHLANALIKAWQDWEAHPGAEYTAARMEAAIQATSKLMGVTGSQLHDALSTKKRVSGLSVARTVRLLFKTIEAEKK